VTTDPRPHAPARRGRGRATVGVIVLVALATIGYEFARGDHTGAATYHGSAAASPVPHPIVDVASTPTGRGYWLAASNGAVYAYGDAKNRGSAAAKPLRKPIVGMAATRTGRGYWLVASDGGIFTFGDARYFGSTGAKRLTQPIVGMAPTRTGNGYWLVAGDGGIFTFGDARYFGSTGAIRLKKPIVGMSRTPSGRGYWLVAADGGVFTFGDARFFGSTGAKRLARPIVGIATTTTGKGYWIVAADGGLFTFGNARFYGSAAGRLGGQLAVGMAASPDGNGYLIASQWGAVNTGSASGFKVDPNLVGRGPQPVANELVTRINRERTTRGLAPLRLDPVLQRFSQAHANHLAATNTFTHQNLMPILNAAGGRFGQAGENLFAARGAGATDAGTAHDALMRSPSHRVNILLPEERFIGVGVACAGGRMVVVQNFASPMGVTLQSRPTPPLQPLAASSLSGASC
jgi:uncharacterized protein YkwD